MRKVRSIIRHGAETFIIESPKLISQMRATIEAADCVGLQRIAHESEAEPLIASLETSAGRVCALLNTLMEEKSCAY